MRMQLVAALICATLLGGCDDPWDEHERYTFRTVDDVTILPDGTVLAAVNSVTTTSYAPGGLDTSPVPPEYHTKLTKYDASNGRPRGGIGFGGLGSSFARIKGVLITDPAHFLTVGSGDGIVTAVYDTAFQRERLLSMGGYYYPGARTCTPVPGGMACIFDDYGETGRTLLFFDLQGNIASGPFVTGGDWDYDSHDCSAYGLSSGNVVLVQRDVIREFNRDGVLVWSHDAAPGYFAAGEDSLHRLLLFGGAGDLIVSTREDGVLNRRDFEIDYDLQNVTAVTRDDRNGWFIACTVANEAMILVHWDGADSARVTDYWNPEGESVAVCAATAPQGWVVFGGYILYGRYAQNGFVRAYSRTGYAVWLETIDG